MTRQPKSPVPTPQPAPVVFEPEFVDGLRNIFDNLVVFNRFGKSEAAGGGLRGEIAEATLSGTPVLIAVRDEMLDAWEAFVGGPWARLAPDAEALLAWAERAVTRREAA